VRGVPAVRVLFWGTPEFAVASLRALSEEGHVVVGVVTQPDRPAGRGRHSRPSAVRVLAEEEGIPVLTPERPVGDEFLAALRALNPEISVVVAYGHILRPAVLDLPPYGSVNVHASLLPELRGAAPIQWAIARGHEATGVTIMRMTPGMDEGPILLQRRVKIEPDETGSELTERLAELGAGALIDALAPGSSALADPIEQDHALATYAPKVSREVARVDWARPAAEVGALVRGMDAVPGAWSLLDEEPVKLFRPRAVEQEGDAGGVPGTLRVADPRGGLVVQCGSGALAFDEVQPPGKRRMEAGAWLASRPGLQGHRFT